MSARSTEELLARYPEAVGTLALRTREFVLQVLPGAEETVDSAAGLLGYGFGPGYKGLVCTLILSKSGVKLGLNRGTELPDPHGLLEGTGKVHRYVQLRTLSDLRRRGLKRLLKEGDAARRQRQASPRSARRQRINE